MTRNGKVLSLESGEQTSLKFCFSLSKWVLALACEEDLSPRPQVKESRKATAGARTVEKQEEHESIAHFCRECMAHLWSGASG